MKRTSNIKTFMLNMKSSHTILHQFTNLQFKHTIKLQQTVFKNSGFVGVKAGIRQTYITILFCILTFCFKQYSAAPPKQKYSIEYVDKTGVLLNIKHHFKCPHIQIVPHFDNTKQLRDTLN